MKKSLKDLLGEQETNTLVTTRTGETKALKLTDKKARELGRDPYVQGIETTAGKKIKEANLNEMEFFVITVVIPEELPNGIAALQRLKYEAQSLVDDSFIDEQGDNITVSFMRKSDANNFVEYARTLGIPEEYIEEPEASSPDIATNDEYAEDEIEEFVSDSVGNEIFLEDIIEVKGKRFKITEGEDGKAHISSLEGRPMLPVGDRRGHALLRSAVRVDDDESGVRNMAVHSIGHIDDEPDMLKQYAYDIVDYGIKLYKILAEFDRMDHHVDLPNWLQANIIKARENVSKAAHYLEYEVNEPKIDAALGENDAN